MAKPNDPPLGSIPRAEEADDSGMTEVRLDTITDQFAKLLGRRAPKPGTVVGGKYRLIRLLGAGAMGEVWEATNAAIEMRVAVKVLKPELLANSQFRTRFQREAVAIASVAHPNVARFFDVVVGDPTFLVMEFVEGRSLKNVLETEGKMPIERALSIALGIARALGAVHAAGVVHRDLKPSNIMLSVDADGVESPRVIDFGLAKVIRTNDGLTRPGQILGTPHYMAPEQIAGHAVDARTDVYSLGCVLFHALTGREPFAGEALDVLYKHVHSAIPALGREISSSLAAVVTRALAKLPADRYQTAGAMARELENELAERRTAGHVLPGFTRRQRQIAAGMAGAILLIGFVVGLLASHRGSGRPAVTPGNGLLVIDTSPSDARVTIDGRALDEHTPTALRGVSAGKHEVRLSRDGFGEAVRQVSTTENGRSALSVTLAPSVRKVVVSTSPPGAEVLVDGELAGTATPVEIGITQGDFHEVRAEKEGYETASRTVRPEDDGKTLEITLQPEKLRRGSLVVDANGAAEVWIDGIFTGFVTPTLPMRVLPGKHVIELRSANGVRLDVATLKIARGENRRLFMAAIPQ